MSDEQFETSRAIDALNDPAWHAFAEALVDRITAISGNAQLRALDEMAALRSQQEAREKNQLLVLDYLKRQDARQEAVSDEISALRADFQGWRATVEAELEDFRQSHQRSIKERLELRADLDEGKADRAAIRIQLNAILALLGELGLDINGRLTELLDASKAASRAEGHIEGRNAERAEQANGG